MVDSTAAATTRPRSVAAVGADGSRFFTTSDQLNHPVVVDGLAVPGWVRFERSHEPDEPDVQVRLEMVGRRMTVAAVSATPREGGRDLVRADLDLDLPAIAARGFAAFAVLAPTATTWTPWSGSADDGAAILAVIRRTQGERPPLDEVAQIYRANITGNPSAAVRSAFPSWSSATVNRWIAQSRRVGLLAPTIQFEKKA